MSTTILVDGNSVGYGEHYATKLKSGDLETQSIYGFVHKMRQLRVGYQNCTPIVLWDGRAQWRFDMHPEYKSNREDDPKKIAIKREYQKARPYIAKALEALGIRQMTAMSHEADDMAGLLTKKLSANPANRIVLLSGDHDWIQLVRPGVTWRDARDATNYVTLDNLLDKTGYKTPLAFLEGKALQGDSSDVIPPVSYRGIGKGTAPQFLARWGSVMNFFKAVDSGAYVPLSRKDPSAATVHPEQALASLEGRKAFARNLKLMQLLNVATPQPADVRLVTGKLDRERFRDLCDELAFLSITKDFDNFLSAF